MRVTRMYTDDSGTSHFDDLEVELTVDVTANHTDSVRFAAPAVFVRAFEENMTWSQHPVPSRQLVVILQGQIEMETSDGQVRSFKPGDVLFAEDLDGPGHVTRTGSDPVSLHVYVPDDFRLEAISGS